MKICAVETCERKSRSGNYCARHYWRFKQHGDPLAGGTFFGEPMAFVMSAVESDTDECIEWPYRLSAPNGYGKFRYKGKDRGAHRVVLSITTGVNIETAGLQAAHGSCHNRKCINPKHLSWKTPKQNTADRRRDGTYQNGDKNPNAKLTNAQTASIASDPRPAKVIAAAYGIDTSSIYKIRQKESGKARRNLGEESA